jgi:cephalosporin-C deacetylase
MIELPYSVPDDLAQFWAETSSEATKVPLQFRRKAQNLVTATDHVVEHIEFLGMDNQTVQGWIAYPAGAHRLSSFLWIPPYGRESLLPNEYGTRLGMVSMSLNLHGEGAFHQEKYHPGRGYFADGVTSPETWIFRTMFQNAMIAARVLQAQGEVDENKVAAMGMSQGGGFSIWLGAWSPIIKAVAADMPFLGNMRDQLSRNAYRYPLKELVDFMDSHPLGRETVLHTMSYFDTVFQAASCKVPALVSMGLKDPAVRPETAEAIFGNLAGDKRLITYDWGHDWHPDMIQNNRDWLQKELQKADNA